MTSNITPAPFSPATKIPPGYRCDAAGLSVQRGEKADSWLQVTGTPVWVAGIGRNGQAEDWSLDLGYTTPDGEVRRAIVSYREVLAKTSSLIQDLAHRGLIVFPMAEIFFRDFLAKSVVQTGVARFRLVRQLGFHALADGTLAFVLPTKTITGHSEEPPAESVAFRPHFDNATFLAYTASGESEQWFSMVTPMWRNRVYLLGTCIGLAAPFASLANIDNALLNMVGETTTGKTTLLQLVGSLYGAATDPQHSSKPTVVERWNATTNAMELFSATHSGIILLIDELGANEEDGLSPYNITGGLSKARMKKDAGMQQQLRWSLFVLSTGEIAISDKIEANTRKRVKGGMIIRALDINFGKLCDWGNLSSEERDTILRAAKEGFGEVYGHLGPTFIQAMLDAYPTEQAMREMLRAGVAEVHEQLCSHARAAGHVLLQPHVRALRRLGLVGAIGLMAQEMLGVSQAQVMDAVQAATLAWLEDLPPLSEEDRIVAQIRDYLVRYQGQIINYDNSNTPILPSQTRAISHKDWVLFTESGFAEACEGTPPRVAAKALAAKGILHREKGKLTSRHVLTRLGFPRAPYYAVILKRLLPDDELHLVGAEGVEDVPNNDEDDPDDYEQQLGELPPRL